MGKMRNEKKYDIILEARVGDAPGFENNTFKIPIKVSVVKISDDYQSTENPKDSLIEKLKELRALYYDAHSLSIVLGDRIKAYGNINQIVKENKPQLIERLNELGGLVAFYVRQDSESGK